MTTHPMQPEPRRRFTIGRAVLVGLAASVVLIAGGFVLLPDRSSPLAEPARAAATLQIDSMPPSRPAPPPSPAAVAAPQPPPTPPASPPPLQVQAKPPQVQASAPSPATVSPPVLVAQQPQAERRVLDGVAVAPPGEGWTTIQGNLGCPETAPGSVLEVLCQFNAQGLAREYQLKLMEQDARKAEILARRAQAERQKKEAEAPRQQQAILPPVEGRPAAPSATPGPTLASIRGTAGTWTATVRLPDGSTVPVRPGQELPGGLRVQRIDRDGVVVKGQGGERRLTISSTPDADPALPRLGSNP